MFFTTRKDCTLHFCIPLIIATSTITETKAYRSYQRKSKIQWLSLVDVHQQRNREWRYALRITAFSVQSNAPFEYILPKHSKNTSNNKYIDFVNAFDKLEDTLSSTRSMCCALLYVTILLLLVITRDFLYDRYFFSFFFFGSGSLRNARSDPLKCAVGLGTPPRDLQSCSSSKWSKSSSG